MFKLIGTLLLPLGLAPAATDPARAQVLADRPLVLFIENYDHAPYVDAPSLGAVLRIRAGHEPLAQDSDLATRLKNRAAALCSEGDGNFNIVGIDALSDPWRIVGPLDLACSRGKPARTTNDRFQEAGATQRRWNNKQASLPTHISPGYKYAWIALEALSQQALRVADRKGRLRCRTLKMGLLKASRTVDAAKELSDFSFPMCSFDGVEIGYEFDAELVDNELFSGLLKELKDLPVSLRMRGRLVRLLLRYGQERGGTPQDLQRATFSNPFQSVGECVVRVEGAVENDPTPGYFVPARLEFSCVQQRGNRKITSQAVFGPKSRFVLKRFKPTTSCRYIENGVLGPDVGKAGVLAVAHGGDAEPRFYVQRNKRRISPGVKEAVVLSVAELERSSSGAPGPCIRLTEVPELRIIDAGKECEALATYSADYDGVAVEATGESACIAGELDKNRRTGISNCTCEDARKAEWRILFHGIPACPPD